MTKFTLKSVFTGLLAISLSLSLSVSSVQAQNTLNIDEILSAANRAAGQDRSAAAAREKRFKATQGKEQGRLNNMVGERKRQEKISDDLDRQFSANEVAIEELQAELIKELGDLKELFGVIQQTASEAQEDYKTSLITQGKIVKFTAPVNYKTSEEVDSEGNKKAIYEPQDREITRVGVFNAVAGNDIASYNNEIGFIALDRQMRGDFNSLSNLRELCSLRMSPNLH